jgi:hypothetical protein
LKSVQRIVRAPVLGFPFVATKDVLGYIVQTLVEHIDAPLILRCSMEGAVPGKRLDAFPIVPKDTALDRF